MISSSEDIADAVSAGISAGVFRFLKRIESMDLAPVFVAVGITTDFALEEMDRYSEQTKEAIWEDAAQAHPAIKPFTKTMLIHVKYSS